MYVYIKSESQLWSVGFYSPSGKWNPESDHSEKEEAAKRVAYLNGIDRSNIITIDKETHKKQIINAYAQGLKAYRSPEEYYDEMYN